jgi:hypothetical protein
MRDTDQRSKQVKQVEVRSDVAAPDCAFDQRINCSVDLFRGSARENPHRALTGLRPHYSVQAAA